MAEFCKVCCLLGLQGLPGVHVWTAVSVELKTPELTGQSGEKESVVQQQRRRRRQTQLDTMGLKIHPGISVSPLCPGQNKNSVAASKSFQSEVHPV